MALPILVLRHGRTGGKACRQQRKNGHPACGFAFVHHEPLNDIDSAGEKRLPTGLGPLYSPPESAQPNLHQVFTSIR
jgi:hypothetical protein